MSRIPNEVIEQVREANDITDIVGEYVQLKKQGRNYLGLCPFHKENTPSFTVSPDKQIFHCFGCGKGGNAATFLMEMEGFSFVEAIRILAEKSGIDLPEQKQEQGPVLSEESAGILEAFQWTAKLYHHLLRHGKEGKEGYQYLLERGLSEEAIDRFQLGYAPMTEGFTATFLEKKGFHKQALAKFGLITTAGDGAALDRFRGRVIFPIRNHLGKTVAFGGRTITGQDAKYLNSPESELFQKSRILFNFDLAKSHIRKTGEAVLCEGYMDAISAYQAGVKNAVATLGTALTEYQARLLRRYVDTVIICYDADNAGQEATYKAGQLLEAAGCTVKTANLQNGMDPDSHIKEHGAESFVNDVIGNSSTFAGFFMKHLKKGFNLSLEGDRIRYVELVTKRLAMIDRTIEREYYLKEISEEFGISLETLMLEAESLRKNTAPKDKTDGKRHTNGSYEKRRNNLLPAFHNAEKKLIAYMLHDSGIARRAQEELGAQFIIETHQVLVTHLYAYLEDHLDGGASGFIEWLPDEELKRLAAELAMQHQVTEHVSDREIKDYIRTIQLESGDKASIKSLKQEQKLAEQQNDPVRAAQIAMQIIEIQKQLKHTN